MPRGPYFEDRPRAQNTKLSLKNENRPRFIPKLTRNTKKIAETSLGTVGGVLKVTSKMRILCPAGHI